MFEASDMPAAVRALLPATFSLVEPPQGETSEVVFVRSPGQHDIVVKRTTNPLYSEWLDREATVLRALASTELPVPQVVARHDEGDAHWLLMTRIPGEDGWTALLEAAPDVRRELLRALGETLARIHSTPIPAALSDADATPWLDRHRLSLAELSVEDELLAPFRSAPPELRTFIHGDFTLDNVLFCEGRVCGVIDWSGCGAGDPRFDIALALATSPELVLEPPDLEAFFAGYTTVDLPQALRTMVRELYGVGYR